MAPVANGAVQLSAYDLLAYMNTVFQKTSTFFLL